MEIVDQFYSGYGDTAKKEGDIENGGTGVYRPLHAEARQDNFRDHRPGSQTGRGEAVKIAEGGDSLFKTKSRYMF